MTQALIQALNKGLYEAGWMVVHNGHSNKDGTWRKAVGPIEEHIQRRIAKAVKAEREACARVCDEQGVGRKALEHYAALTYSGAAHDCAAAIRARGNT